MSRLKRLEKSKVKFEVNGISNNVYVIRANDKAIATATGDGEIVVDPKTNIMDGVMKEFGKSGLDRDKTHTEKILITMAYLTHFKRSSYYGSDNCLYAKVADHKDEIHIRTFDTDVVNIKNFEAVVDKRKLSNGYYVVLDDSTESISLFNVDYNIGNSNIRRVEDTIRYDLSTADEMYNVINLEEDKLILINRTVASEITLEKAEVKFLLFLKKIKELSGLDLSKDSDKFAEFISNAFFDMEDYSFRSMYKVIIIKLNDISDPEYIPLIITKESLYGIDDYIDTLNLPKIRYNYTDELFFALCDKYKIKEEGVYLFINVEDESAAIYDYEL